jgi:hypothetical protein
MRKLWILPIVVLMAFPFVAAQESCGLTNLAVCLPQKFVEYALSLINAPLAPFLGFIQSMMSEPVNVSLFSPIWAIIIYIISLFYGLFLVFVGFNFIISGYDSAKRENAKHWLRNIVLMIIFVQASYFLYELILQLAALLTAGVFSIINQNFFLLTVDNAANLAFELVFSTSYLLTLVLSALLLVLRYLFVAVGVIFFPIGIFFNFIEPLAGYGKLIINSLLIMIFLPFFQAIVLLASSKLLELDTFGSFKIMIMIGAFTIANLMMILLVLFAVVKAVNSAAHSEVGKVIIAGAKSLA